MKFQAKALHTALGLVAIATLGGCSKTPSPEQIATGGDLCQKFIASEMKGSAALETTVYDSWMKKDKVVFEIGYREKFGSKSSYSVRLCVYDEAGGTLTSPSPLNSDEWKK